MNSEKLNEHIKSANACLNTLQGLLDDQKHFDYDLNQLIGHIHNMAELQKGFIYEAEQKLDALTGGQ